MKHPTWQLLGIESDKNRCQQAEALLASGKGGGTALWSAIEDATVDQPVSLLWFNPPYDRIRGAGRTEAALFNRVKEWPVRGSGLLLMIVPDHVLADADVGLAVAVERDFELLGGMLLECEAFGVLEGLRSFVLSANARETFDGIIADYVRLRGLPCRAEATPN